MSNSEDDPGRTERADRDAASDWGEAWRDDDAEADDAAADGATAGDAPAVSATADRAASADTGESSESALADDLLGPKPQADRGPPDRSRRFRVVEAVVHLLMFGLTVVLIAGLGVLAAGSQPILAATFAVLLLVVLVTMESNLDEWATWITERLVEE